MSESDKIRLFLPRKEAVPDPVHMTSVLRWICPHCRESNPFDDGMNDEVVACLSCGKLARPHNDTTDTPLLPSESAKARKLLEW